MENRLSAITDFLNEQSWFQELKTKWEELDPQSRGYLKLATGGTTVLLVLYFVLSMIWSVHHLKHELSDKQELLTLINSANDEVRRLHENGTPPPAADQTGKWGEYFESMAGNAGFEKSIMTVSPEKSIANTGGNTVAKEWEIDINLKKATIRQVVKFAYFLENGNRPVRLRNLTVNTNADPEGYLDATLSVSVFSLNEGKK